MDAIECAETELRSTGFSVPGLHRIRRPESLLFPASMLFGLVLLLASSLSASASDQVLVVSGGIGDIRYSQGDDVRVGERTDSYFPVDIFIRSSNRFRWSGIASLELYAWNRIGIGGMWIWMEDLYEPPLQTPGVESSIYINMLHRLETVQLVPYLSDDRSVRWILVNGSGMTTYEAREMAGGEQIAGSTSTGTVRLDAVMLEWDALALASLVGRPTVATDAVTGGRIGVMRLRTEMEPGPAGQRFDGSGYLYFLSIRFSVF